MTRYRGGVFIPKALVEREKSVASAAYPVLEREFGEELQYHRAVVETLSLVPDGVKAPLSMTTVEARAKATIRNAYTRAFLLGKRAAGNLTSADDSEARLLVATRRDEYTYLRRFLSDMKAGAGKLPYEQRMAYYQHALREAFWYGYLLGDRRASRRIWWSFGKTVEHCKDCASLAARTDGIPIAEFFDDLIPRGIVPQSGKLECHGLLCECWITDTRGSRVISV